MSDKTEKRLFDEFEPVGYDAWRKAAEETLDGAPFEKKLITKTYENIDLQPIYFPGGNDDMAANANFPGVYNYLRSNGAAGYKAKIWEICQDIPYPDPSDFNTAAKRDIAKGADSIYVNLNNSFYFNSGKSELDKDTICNGLLLNTIDDFEIAFSGIDLNKIPIYFNPGMKATAFAAAFAAYVENSGYDKEAVRGAIDFDPHSNLLTDGKCCSVDSAYTRMTLLTNWCNINLPKFTCLAVKGATFHNAGANAVQELAYSLSSAVAYIRGLQANGLEIDRIASKIRFIFAIGSNFFSEIAKLRAARTLWAKIIKEFGGSERSQKMRIHCVSSLVNRSNLDAYTNILRNTVETFSAVIGSADIVQIGGFDEALGLPEEFSRRITRNTQHVIREESHIADTIDPAGGSWYVEKLTDEIARASYNLFVETEKAGGFVEAVKAGLIQSEIEKTAEKRIQSLASRKDVLVGVNKYPNLKEREINLFNIDSDILASKYSEKYGKTCSREENSSTNELIRQSGEEICANKVSSLDTAKEAVKAGAAIFELVDAFCGNVTWINAPKLKSLRLSEMFENLRSKSESYKIKHGFYPKVSLLNFGAVRDWKGRSDFSFDFFLVGGFDAVNSPAFENVNEAIEYVQTNDAKIIVICSSDDKYPTFVPDLAKQLKANFPDRKTILAGLPKDYVEQFRDAGVDEFIHVKANIYEVLNKLMTELGIGMEG